MVFTEGILFTLFEENITSTIPEDQSRTNEASKVDLNMSRRPNDFRRFSNLIRRSAYIINSLPKIAEITRCINLALYVYFRLWQVKGDLKMISQMVSKFKQVSPAACLENCRLRKSHPRLPASSC